jgi:hypothetical protein
MCPIANVRAPRRYSRARELHKRLHIYRTFDDEQVVLNEKAPTCGAFAEPSDGLEPSTPSLTLRGTSPVTFEDY